jgi:hypothetical protein
VARFRFRTKFVHTRRGLNHTRPRRKRHGFLTTQTRRHTGGKMIGHKHVAHKKSVHPGRIITRKTRRKSAARSGTTRLRHHRAAKHPHKTSAHRRTGRHLSATARQHISAALKGKRHPHRGHAMSSATRAKISAKLKGRHHAGRIHSNRLRHKAERHHPGRQKRQRKPPKPK